MTVSNLGLINCFLQSVPTQFFQSYLYFTKDAQEEINREREREKERRRYVERSRHDGKSISSSDNESFRAEKEGEGKPTRRGRHERKIPARGRRNELHFSALNLNTVYVTAAKQHRAYSRVARDEPWQTRRVSRSCVHTVFPADFIYCTTDSGDKGTNQPCHVAHAAYERGWKIKFSADEKFDTA